MDDDVSRATMKDDNGVSSHLGQGRQRLSGDDGMRSTIVIILSENVNANGTVYVPNLKLNQLFD